jgi:hypothetical protein
MKVNIYGQISQVRNIPTRTGRKMIGFLIGTRSCVAFWYVAVAIETLSGESVSATADKGTYKGEIQYVVKTAYIPDQIEPEEEGVKPLEWLMPQLSRFIAERSRKPTNSDARSCDKSKELQK